jgi:hypothetical protein
VIHSATAAAALAVIGWGWAVAQTATLRSEAFPLEDPKLRAEAVRLLERANLVSTPGVWPPNEMRLHFRLGDPPEGFPHEGEYVSSVGGPGLRRQEWNYGNFQHTQVRNQKRLRLDQAKVPMPAALNTLNEMAPIYLVRFDDRDVIRAVVQPSDGIRCIDFDTVTGEQSQSNEICVDEKNGWLLSIRAGDVLTKNSDFFLFGRSFLPGHIERWRGSRLVMAVDETVTLKSDYPVDYFEVPESSTAFICQDFRRAFEISTPQPEPRGRSNDIIDIRLTGYIDANGRVGGLAPVETSRPDLNIEALNLVSSWTYSPAQCGGEAVWWQTTFTVRFKER